MAEKPKTPANPLDAINEAALKHLEEFGDDIDQALADAEVLEKLGLDVSHLKERLTFSKQAREVLLERFRKK